MGCHGDIAKTHKTMTVGELMGILVAAGNVGKKLYVRLPDGSERKIVGSYGDGLNTPYRSYVLLYGEDGGNGAAASVILDDMVYAVKRFAALNVVAVGRRVELPQGVAYTDEAQVSGIEAGDGRLTLLCGEAEAPKVKADEKDAASVLRDIAYRRLTIRVNCWYGDKCAVLENPTLAQFIAVLMSADCIEPRPQIAVYAFEGGEEWDVGRALGEYLKTLKNP